VRHPLHVVQRAGLSRYRAHDTTWIGAYPQRERKYAAALPAGPPGANTASEGQPLSRPDPERAPGHRRAAASGDGPSPSVSWSSASAHRPHRDRHQVTCRLSTVAGAQPLPRGPVPRRRAAAQASEADTSPPCLAAWPATRPRSLPCRLTVIRAGPSGQQDRHGRGHQPDTGHGAPLLLQRQAGSRPVRVHRLSSRLTIPPLRCLQSLRAASDPVSLTTISLVMTVCGFGLFPRRGWRA